MINDLSDRHHCTPTKRIIQETLCFWYFLALEPVWKPWFLHQLGKHQEKCRSLENFVDCRLTIVDLNGQVASVDWFFQKLIRCTSLRRTNLIQHETTVYHTGMNVFEQISNVLVFLLQLVTPTSVSRQVRYQEVIRNVLLSF